MRTHTGVRQHPDGAAAVEKCNSGSLKAKRRVGELSKAQWLLVEQ
jgi:hypothetical protein